LHGVDIVIIFHKKIVGPDHNEDDLRISRFLSDDLDFIQEALRGLAGGTQVLDFEMRNALLPVKIGNQRIPEKK
jgi:hypothetical protein